MDDAPIVLEAVGLVKEYGERVKARVLHGVDLVLRQGELVALVGPSGSGKSTLLNLVGLLDRPTSGTIHIEGVEATALDERGLTALRGRALGFVFQFHHLLQAFTATENVMMPAWGAAGRPTPAMRARAREMLQAVGLADKLDARPAALSGGQQQRVAVARALAHAPPLVLADEPTGNLDTHAADEVLELMRSASRARGAAVLVVTHDPRIAARCERVITIVDGRVVSDGPARSP